MTRGGTTSTAIKTDRHCLIDSASDGYPRLLSRSMGNTGQFISRWDRHHDIK